MYLFQSLMIETDKLRESVSDPHPERTLELS